MTIRAYGRRALLVEVPDHHEALSLFEALTSGGVPGVEDVIDVVPAAVTVLVTFRRDIGPTVAGALGAWIVGRRRDVAGAGPLAAHAAHAADATPSPVVEIPTVYDGEDLGVVADLTGLTAEEVVRRHTQASYVVAFLGFAPGFAYLVGGDPLLAVPRRATPRPRVPAGAVAIAGEYSAVYPRSSPGGWQILGRTGARLWDLEAVGGPSLLGPGTRVRFVASGVPS